MNNQDQKIYKKAKSRVIFHLVFSMILMILYFIGVYFVLNIDFLKVTNTNINSVVITLGASQICLFLLIFLLLSFGKKIFRIFYWLAFILTLALYYIPVRYALNDMAHILTYATMLGFMFIKTLFLIQLGSYLKNNKWARVYYDWVIDVYEEEYIEPPTRKIDPRPTKKQEVYYETPPQQYQTYEQEEEDYEDYEEEPYTQPQVSIRLGICVYASLMIFPIFIQIFSNYFSSYDLQTVFATKDMFMLCIFSALVWTVPIFYLYYDHPYSKRIVLVCAILEILCILFYAPKFIGYYIDQDPKYPLRVFILFAIIDCVRYAALVFALKPLTSIESSKSEDDF